MFPVSCTTVRFIALACMGLLAVLMGTASSYAADPVLGSADSVSPSELNRLRKGEIIVVEPKSTTEKKDLRFVVAKLLIDRPVETVWSAVQDQENLFKGEPHFKKVQIIEQPSASKQLVATTLWLSRLLPTFNYVSTVNYTKSNWTVNFSRLRGSFKSFNGITKLKPIDNNQKTIMIYGLRVDPGLLVPQMVTQGILKSELPRMMTHVRNRVQAQPAQLHDASPKLDKH